MATPTFVSRVFNLEFQPLNFFQGNFHIISRVFNGDFNGKRCIVCACTKTSKSYLLFEAVFLHLQLIPPEFGGNIQDYVKHLEDTPSEVFSSEVIVPACFIFLNRKAN